MSIKENHNSNEIDKNSDEVSIISKNDIQINTKNFRHSKTIQPHKYMVVRIVLVTLIFYVLSSILDIYEHLNEFVEKHENINLDEFIIAGVFLAFWMIIEILMLLKVVKKQSLNHEKSSFIDSLTQVNNRRGFFKDAEEKFKKNSKIHNGLSIYYLDLLQFKSINDDYGHINGDKVLKETAQHLKALLNKEDIIARIGGDEFVIITMESSNEISQNYSDLLKQGIKVEIDHEKKSIEVFLSFGKATYPNDGNNLEDLLNHADIGMYVMKDYQNNEISGKKE